LIIDSQVKEFVETYIKTFDALSSKLTREERILLFPEYLASPHKIRCVISKAGKISIDFAEQASQWSIDVSYGDEVEYVVIQGGDTSRSFIENKGKHNTIESMNLITHAFYDKHKDLVDVLTRATNMVMENPGSFVKVDSGDLRLIDVGLACYKNDSVFVRKLRCLWLIADESIVNADNARKTATDDYEQIIYRRMGSTPLPMLAGTLGEYQKLLVKDSLIEEEMQGFLERNFSLLEPSYRRVFTKGELRKFKMPEADFLVKTSDPKKLYVLVELESPQDPLFTNEKRPNESKDLRAANSQMRQYLSDFRNDISFYRKYFTDISVENVGGLVVIGRTGPMTDDQKRAFQNLNATLQGYEIRTYDQLFDQTKALLENLVIRYSPFK
jgi:hypothetical protein